MHVCFNTLLEKYSSTIWQLANMACVAVAQIFHGWVIPGSFHEHLQTTVHYVHDVLQTASRLAKQSQVTQLEDLPKRFHEAIPDLALRALGV